MNEKNNNSPPFSLQTRRILLLALAWAVLPIIFIFLFFQNGFNYCIIYFLGSVISVSGFAALGRTVDRYLKQGRNQAFYFAVSLAKLVLIGGGFYLAARMSGGAILFYIAGLLVIIAALFTEAVLQLFRRTSACRNIKS